MIDRYHTKYCDKCEQDTAHTVDGECTCCLEEMAEKHQTDEIAPSNSSDLLSAQQGSNLVDKLYTYQDMVAAFTAGRRHYKECADTDNDCWDFTTWAKKHFGI